MKRTTRNNIVRYVISAVFVSAFLLITLLVCMGLDWLTDISGWPVKDVAYITGFIWLCWAVGRRITIKEDKEK